MTGPAIAANAVTRRFGPTIAVDRLDLQVARGEILGLLGPNGSGKTTLIRMIAGFLNPTEGSITVAGHDTVDDAMTTRRRIGYVPESVPLYRHMRVREFLAFMARLRGIEGGEVDAAIDRVAGSLALGEVIDKPIPALSRGYRQRVGIAQALVHDPEIVLLDEPANGLDPRQIIELRRTIQALAGRHTVVLSSHILSEVGRVADRVAIMLRGRLLGVRSVAETPDLEAWFLSLT
ncbi:MAG: ABC transporter ATP-binding protein [Alphaproteobacteria bacterium]|nr:ABC transporter ATP-binding protein [Alphaproteobacteria bacterium]